MKELMAIRDLYKPIQPAVKFDNQKILYKEIRPLKEVDSFIYCYWQLKSQTPLMEPFSYRVVSDGCIDIFFERNSPNQSFVMGFFRKYTEFSLGKTFNYFGIRFLPSAFPLLFNVSAKALSNTSQELINVLPQFSEWISNHISQTQSFHEITALMNAKMNNFILLKKFNFDSRFQNALIKIFEHNGFLDIEKDLNTGLSPRQLRRIFDVYIGTTPKAFCNVIRFQHILNAKPSRQSLKENKLYLDVGFFDQAHFINNFKRFYGVTPSVAFR